MCVHAPESHRRAPKEPDGKAEQRKQAMEQKRLTSDSAHSDQGMFVQRAEF
jgi:hypothetical protein